MTQPIESSAPQTLSMQADCLMNQLDFLWLQLTNKCNLECVHCYADSGPTLPLRSEMDYEEWHKVLAEGSALGCRKVQFIGGEPTLYPQLLSLVKDAKSLGYTLVEVFTNGTFLSDSMLMAFRDHDVRLAFSVYSSDSDVHDRITQRKGSHQKTMASMKKATSYGIPVRVGVVEMDENRNQFRDTEQYVKSIGAQSVGADRIRGIGRGTAKVKSDDQWGELCGACWRGRLAVNPAGDVSPCVMSGFYKLGPVSQGLRSILQSDTLHVFRERVRASEAASEMGKPGCCPKNLVCKPF